ncbi:uncharacterized protein CCOS01_05882 [Colletotrichum costaricense]|uniref:Uncharacterized protein n=1 Tax=Colletotrichum costaricense TaxID=1209916 RepID=A0AAI9Z1D1_9PEZI|nr:uncharacterized protein CCOS01_05882 [Colletotrichum costaricense]KAK1530779.1 hypothetical protein CCOS01_05882 [Colletotrichum costaricense]
MTGERAGVMEKKQVPPSTPPPGANTDQLPTTMMGRMRRRGPRSAPDQDVAKEVQAQGDLMG